MQLYFDPMCYQLYFCAFSIQEAEPILCQHIWGILHELRPCIEKYVEVSDPWSMTICVDNWMLPLSKDNINMMYSKISNNHFRHLQLMHLRKKLPRELAVQLSTKEVRAMQDRTQLISDTNPKQIDPARVCSLLSCPSSDLKGILYPAKQFWHNFFSIQYVSTPVSQLSDDPCFRHEIYIQLPRVVVEHTTNRFTYQDSWRARLKDMCSCFNVATGAIKLDATASHYSCGILNRFTSDTSISGALLPGYSWLLCITKPQLSNLGGIDTVKAWNLFNQCTSLDNGGAMLQLTEYVDIIEQVVNDRMVSKLRPFLKFQPTGLMDDIPISFRLSLGIDDVIVVEKDRYKLNIPI